MIHRFLGGMIGLFRVVPVNEAHIRILMNKKEIFCSREKFKSAYWYVPFLTKLHKLPLCNLAIPVNEFYWYDKWGIEFNLTCEKKDVEIKTINKDESECREK